MGIIQEWFSTPLAKDDMGWIYVNVFNGSENELSSIDFSVKVNTDIYNNWYDTVQDWSEVEALGTASKPGQVSVEPESPGVTWTASSLELQASCFNADTIYYTASKNGVPDDPDSQNNDGVITGNNGIVPIVGSDGDDLFAVVNEQSSFTIKLRGSNSEGLGPVDAFEYTLDTREQTPDLVEGMSASGTYNVSPLAMNLNSPGATHVVAYATDLDQDHAPDEPDATTVDVRRGSGKYEGLTAELGESRHFSVQYRAWNEYSDEYGPWSDEYDYTIDYTSPAPAQPEVAGSCPALVITSSHAEEIWYTYSVAQGDAEPTDPSTDPADARKLGTVGADFQASMDLRTSLGLDADKTSNIKIRFFGYNSIRKFGQPTDVKEYTYVGNSIEAPGVDDDDNGGPEKSLEERLEEFLNGGSSSTGSVRVDIRPYNAVKSGAKWSVPGKAWTQSGNRLADVTTGTHELRFRDIKGYVRPDLEVAVEKGKTTRVAARYILTEEKAKSTRMNLNGYAKGTDGEIDCSLPIVKDGETSEMFCLSGLIQRIFNDVSSIDVQVPYGGDFVNISGDGYSIPVKIVDVTTTPKEHALEMNKNEEFVLCESGIAITVAPAPVDESIFTNSNPFPQSAMIPDIDEHGFLTQNRLDDSQILARFHYVAEQGLPPSELPGSDKVAVIQDRFPWRAVYPNGSAQQLLPVIYDQGPFMDLVESYGLQVQTSLVDGLVSIQDSQNQTVLKFRPSYYIQTVDQKAGDHPAYEFNDQDGDELIDLILYFENGTKKQVFFTRSP